MTLRQRLQVTSSADFIVIVIKHYYDVSKTSNFIFHIELQRTIIRLHTLLLKHKVNPILGF